MGKRTLAEEYEICQERGHVSGSAITMGRRTTEYCMYCRTSYYYERTLHESNVPEELDS